MKNFIRNLIIILFYLTSIPFWRRLFLQKPLVRIWCLHEIKEGQVEQFEKKIQYLKKNFNVITPYQFTNEQLVNDKLNILFTFDDGYDSWFKNVLPILGKHNIKAIFFIRTEFFAKAGEIVNHGHLVGGHSVSHPYLPKLSAEELEQEVSQSVKSEFFAYPFGSRKSYNQNVINKVKASNYKYGFTILPGFNNNKTNPMLLHRDSLDADVSDLIFKLWLKGCYDWK